jgi:biopolymer transport protein ExbD
MRSLLVLLLATAASAAPVEIDREANEVRVAAQALRVDMPLEFICVVTGTADHESLLRTTVRPSEIHAALLALGLEPGRPVRYSEAANAWLPPTGPPVRVDVEFERDGRVIRERVGRLVRNVKTGQAMPPRTFVFVGSRLYETPDGQMAYAADATGQVVTLVNFDTPVIDVAELASSANETLEWEHDPDAMPEAGTPVTMILSPVGGDVVIPATRPADEAQPVVVVKLGADRTLRVGTEDVTREQVAEAVRRKTQQAEEVRVRLVVERNVQFQRALDILDLFEKAGIDNVALRVADPEEQSVVDSKADQLAALRQQWEARVLPQSDALQQAAQTHYEVMQAYQTEINALLDRADKLRREMDELQRRFDDLTTPRPMPVEDEEAS